MQFKSVCAVCKHSFKTQPGCTAYPKGNIPKEIVQGKITHEKPHPGDHGTQWAARDDLDSAFVKEFMTEVRAGARKK